MMNKFQANKLFDELFPITRSITGDGYRKSLNILSRFIKFKKMEYKTGKKVFDWTVPKEWVFKNASIILNKKKILDAKRNNLHVMSYSAPINKYLNLKRLNKYLYSIKEQPNVIPYVTSYYKRNIGFCIKHSDKKKLKPGNYKAVIQTKFINGKIVNGVAELKGETKKIILITSYLCHPSLANNELSGPISLLGLYEKIRKWKKRRFNYMFLINPETIGSICFLNSFKNRLIKNLYGGLVLTCLGGPKKKLSYKKSRMGNSPFDKIFEYLNKKDKVFIRKFDPTEGSDERQFCSSELNLPVGQIARTVYGTTPQYHNSSDNKKYMKISQIMKSINNIEKILKFNESLYFLKRKIPFCELKLSKRNLYPQINFTKYIKNKKKFTDLEKRRKILVLLLSYADGKSNILDICNNSNFKINEIIPVLNMCVKKKMIKLIT